MAWSGAIITYTLHGSINISPRSWTWACQLSGKDQVMPMKILSDGQKVGVIFVWLAFRQMLLLDEPTNHLDIQTIDFLAEA
jgi:ATPase subunit of ABC transporter with duplicated ATPase domains